MKCKEKPAIRLESGETLCKNCFNKYFEKKSFRTIIKYGLIEKDDKEIAVAVSGGKDSLSVLHVIDLYASKRKNLKITAILVDEGIKGYREHTIRDAKKACKQRGIKLETVSFKKEFGCTLDDMVKIADVSPCSLCGVFRRYLLNKKAREIGVTKLATGHNMDDEAQAIIMNQLRRNVETSARLGPITGVVKDPRFVRRIKPFYFLSEKEVAIFAFMKKFVGKWNECPYAATSYRGDVRGMLNGFEEKYPGTKHSIVSSFMEILPLLKEHYKSKGSIRECRICKEPCSSEVCRACEMREMLKRQARALHKRK